MIVNGKIFVDLIGAETAVEAINFLATMSGVNG
jgi:hypothetical protein